MVAVRQFVTAAVLLPVAWPDLRRLTWARWWPTLLLGLVFATMNLRLYTAIDRIGLGLGLLAAVCGAAYIVLNRLVGARLPGLQAPAAATTVSALMYVPVAVMLFLHGRWEAVAILYAVGAGVLSSVVPYAADLIALRRVPARFFGVFMSIHPVLAALAGLLLLGQAMKLHEWAGIAVVVAANTVAVGAVSSRPAMVDH